jgi:large subunit ribosomal protein L25
MITIKAIARDVKVSPKSIRKEGRIPAVYYGFGKKSTMISVDRLEFEKAFQSAGETTIVTLDTPEGKLDALIHEVAPHVVTGEAIHIDFYIAAKDHKIEVDVPLEFVGTSPAEKEGGVVSKIMHELPIEALPAKLPQHITVDLSKLATLDSHIAVGDLDLGDGVKALIPMSEVVALVALPHAEEEAPASSPDLAAIEVEKKGKKEEEESAK